MSDSLNSFYSQEQFMRKQYEEMQRMAIGQLYGGGLGQILGQQGFFAGNGTTNNSDSENKLLLLEDTNEADTI